MAPVNRKHKEKMTERAEKRDKKAASAPKREEDDADEDEDDADDVDDEYEEATSSKRRVQKPKGYFANIKWKHVRRRRSNPPVGCVTRSRRAPLLPPPRLERTRPAAMLSHSLLVSLATASTPPHTDRPSAVRPAGGRSRSW